MKDFALLVIIAGAWGILSVVSEKSDQHESHEKFTDVELTDELLNVVVKGLWLVKYLPEGIQVIEAKSQNNFFRIYFVNPSFHNQSCFFQFAYCHFCSNQVKPYVPACSSPCPGFRGVSKTLVQFPYNTRISTVTAAFEFRMRTCEIFLMIVGILGIPSLASHHRLNAGHAHQPGFKSQPRNVLQGFHSILPFQQEHKQYKNVDITPQLEQKVHQGLRMVNYDPSGIQLQKATTGRNFVRISYLNPALQNQRCYFQFRPCDVCQSSMEPYRPVCSSPCPLNACKVDYSLRVMNSKDFQHQKHWKNAEFDEKTDYQERNLQAYDRLGHGNFANQYMNPWMSLQQ
ncbi:hypothetical protein GE061_012460 [Apolygus lucorum]|uniref:Uncharacterized protein n=1 Tax=Apolygus lucorum TaxID=248454 RepID=A0A8S9XSL3_APOLU|nr:hypothetical protein GE061_012460 [Apolygus lucorum]